MDTTLNLNNTLLACQNTTDSLNETLTSCTLDKDICEIDFGTNKSSLITCTEDKITCETDLSTKTTDLATCTTDKDTCWSDKTECDVSLQAETIALATCIAGKATCETSLGTNKSSLATCTLVKDTCETDLGTNKSTLLTCEADKADLIVLATCQTSNETVALVSCSLGNSFTTLKYVNKSVSVSGIYIISNHLTASDINHNFELIEINGARIPISIWERAIIEEIFTNTIKSIFFTLNLKVKNNYTPGVNIGLVNYNRDVAHLHCENSYITGNITFQEYFISFNYINCSRCSGVFIKTERNLPNLPQQVSSFNAQPEVDCSSIFA